MLRTVKELRHSETVSAKKCYTFIPIVVARVVYMLAGTRVP